MQKFTAKNFLLRWVVALALVLATFNPSHLSYFDWVTGPGQGYWSVKAIIGIGLVILYVIYMRATWRSIGPVGVILVSAMFAAVIWLLSDFGLLDPSSGTVVTYLALILLATIMAVGLSWSHVRRRLSGQADMDDVDE